MEYSDNHFKNLFFFSGRILSRLLTHTHLPGLSSLDQMHLLALADTVSTCDADFAERLASNARIDMNPSSGQEILPGKCLYTVSASSSVHPDIDSGVLSVLHIL